MSGPKKRNRPEASHFQYRIPFPVHFQPVRDLYRELHRLEAYATTQDNRLEAYATTQDNRLEAYATTQDNRLEAYATIEQSLELRERVAAGKVVCVLDF